MNRTALIAGFAVAIVGVGLFALYMRRFENEATGGEPVEVLMITSDLSIGEPLTAQKLGTRGIPQAYLEDRHVLARDQERVLGIRVSNGLRANQSLLWTDLATTSEQRRDLSALVQESQRAITIRADVSASFGGLLRPGDRVDVLLTVEREPNQFVTVVLLQGRLVLASGRDTGAPLRPGERRTTNSGTVNQVTLSVTLEQAAALALAQEQGRLTLVLRNPDDINTVENPRDTTTQDVMGVEGRQQLQRRGPTRPQQPSLPTRVE
ncbi:MAG: Flp pilus assembly protein CpaB [Myxococcales bacterium]|nr:Flp pilus assembly protein CpaB [Myxococcales bacterium]